MMNDRIWPALILPAILLVFVFALSFGVVTVVQSVFGQTFPLGTSEPLPLPQNLEMSLSDCDGVTVLLWNFSLDGKRYSIATSDHRWAVYQHEPVKHVWLGHWTDAVEPTVDKEFDTFEEARDQYPGGCRWLSLGPPI